MKEAEEGQTQAPNPPEAKDPAHSEKVPHLASFLLLDASFHVAVNKCVRADGSPTFRSKDPGPAGDVEFKVAESGRGELF